MDSLSPEKILAVWEAGREQHELDRALTLLSLESPATSRAELARLPIGERDVRLLRLRRTLFGDRAVGQTECPKCAVRVELPIDTVALEQTAPPHAETREFHFAGSRVCFRALTTQDIAHLAQSPDATQGTTALLERCITGISGNSAKTVSALGPDFVESFSDALLEADPNAEITFDLTCPECDYTWSLLFDVPEFLWTEVSAIARRIFREVDVIARAYGWSEQQILSLTSQRRQSYLELIEG